MAILDPRRRRTRRLWTFITSATLLSALLLFLIASASANLPGSPFDAGDGNLVLNDEAQDWANAPNLQTGIDITPAASDNSFGQGTKEDTAVPTVVTGSIPPNKSDLTRFYVANQRVAGKDFLYLAWERVQEPQGTTNMDFEFNKSSTLSANGVTPVRSEGDVLIKYDLSQGGSNPTLGLHRWVTSGTPAVVCQASNSVPCWGPVQSLAGNFEGAINSVPVTDPIPPAAPRTLSVRTFGEAAINLTDSNILPAGTCGGFSGAYLKSRASDSFTAALKDFIAPIPVEIRNCGEIIIDKVTDPSGDPTSFDFTLTGGPSNLNQSFSLTDASTPHSSGQVLAGSGYSAAETVPAGWELTSATCDDGSPVTNIDVSIDETVTCTFNDRARGTIIVEKITDDGFGAFDFTSTTLTPAAFTLTTTAPGDAGKDSATFGDLAPGPYDVDETVPAGWNLASSACVSDQGDSETPASIGLDAGETVTCTFHDARERGAILITKTRKHAADGEGDHPHGGVEFVITGGELPAGGTPVTTDVDGEACLDGLLLGNYTVTETVPAGYHASKASDTVTVSAESRCGDGNEADVSFHNTPLTDFTVSVDAQVDGGTASTIECVDSANNSVASGSTGPNGDGSETASDLEPDTYTCTIVIDP